MKLKKSLGQNFFNNPNLANQIIQYISMYSPTSILEIGPGDGYFTERLQNICKDLTVVEKDDELAHNLSIKFKNIKILNEDFNELNLNTLKHNKYTVFGSLPYNVAKFIIRNILENPKFENMFFILQKEVAEKYAFTSGSSLIGMSTKLYVDTKIVYNISAGSFIPRPKVDSAFITMTRNSNLEKTQEKRYLKIVKQAFTNPRKTLRNNLKSLIEIDNNEIFNKRAQELSFEDFSYITNTYNDIIRR